MARSANPVNRNRWRLDADRLATSGGARDPRDADNRQAPLIADFDPVGLLPPRGATKPRKPTTDVGCRCTRETSRSQLA